MSSKPIPESEWVVSRTPLDADEARRLKRLVRASLSRRVFLDLDGVREIDVMGIGAILAFDSLCSAEGRSLHVVPPHGHAGEVLMLLGGSGRLQFVGARRRHRGAGASADDRTTIFPA